MSPLRTVRVEQSRNTRNWGPKLGRASSGLLCRSQPQARARAGWERAEPLMVSKTLAMGSISVNFSFLI